MKPQQDRQQPPAFDQPARLEAKKKLATTAAAVARRSCAK
jgi:hypothetical protein